MYVYVPEEMVRGVMFEIRQKRTVLDMMRAARHKIGAYLATVRMEDQQPERPERPERERTEDTVTISEETKRSIAEKTARLYRAYLRAGTEAAKDETYREYRFYRELCADLGMSRTVQTMIDKIEEEFAAEHAVRPEKTQQYVVLFRDGSEDTISGTSLADAFEVAGYDPTMIAMVKRFQIVR